MPIYIKTVLLMIVSLLASLAMADAPPPVESEYFFGAGGGFTVVSGEVAYALILEIRKPLPEGFRLEFSFENPQKKQPPITETSSLDVSEKQVLVKSVALQCIRNNRRYSVTVTIHTGDLLSEPIATHEQELEFNLPKQLIKQVGIRLC